MTFIASVIAQKGVAVIADSLVTTSRPIIEYEDFNTLLAEKVGGRKRGRKPEPKNISLKMAEIGQLFKVKPSYTKNYEEKLFKYDNYTAITIAGAVEINDKRVSKIIHDIVKKNEDNIRSYSKKKFETKLNEFIEYLKTNLISHLKKYKKTRTTIFIVTHFDVSTETSIIYKLTVKTITLDQYNNNNAIEFISVVLNEEPSKVVCDGQNKISERILWGELDFMTFIVPKVLNIVSGDFPDIKDKITNDYIMKILQHNDILGNGYVYEDIKMSKLTNLSLQQAVDLACLLMKIEVDIQKFTENIQTVGGVIKLAVIDKNGFSFVAGHEVILPNTI